MRQAIRNFLAWLDQRFPEKVVITQASFLELKGQIEDLRKQELDRRLKMAEAEINKFNVNMGFGGKIDAAMKVFQR